MVSSEGLNKNIAALLTLEGAGFVKHPDGSQSPLWQGIKLSVGDIVVTSPGSKAVIVLTDGSEFEFGKAQGDAVKIDASVLDLVSEINEIRVLDLSYLYPLLNNSQVDHSSAHIDETAPTLVVVDGVDSSEIKELLDGSNATNPAASGDLGGGDLTGGNRYVVLESNPIAHDTNPFSTNPIPEFGQHPEFAQHLDRQLSGPEETTPLALLLTSFNQPVPVLVAPEVPVDPPVAPEPISITLSLAPGFSDPQLVNDDAPVTYHVSLSHAADSALTFTPVLVWVNGNDYSGTIDLAPITIARGDTTYDIKVSLPEELDTSDVSYKLFLTFEPIEGVSVLEDLAPDVYAPHEGVQVVVAHDFQLSVASDYSAEPSESMVSINWQDVSVPAPATLDDEGNNATITVTVKDPEILQHVDASPKLFDVWAVDVVGEREFVIAHLSTSSSASFDPSQFPDDGLPVILATDNGIDTLYFDGIPTNFGEGEYGVNFTLVVTPTGLDSHTDAFPTNFLSSDEPTTWTSLDLPLFVDVLQESLGFTIHSDSFAAGSWIEETHGQESQFTITFTGELRGPITLEVTIDALGTGTSIIFDPNNIDSALGSGYAVYDPGSDSYSFSYVIPDTEDGILHQISLAFDPTIDLVVAGFEELASSLPTVEYGIYPDVDVTLGDFLTVDDELGASATVSIDIALAEALSLQVLVVDAADPTNFWYETVRIPAGDTSALLIVSLGESTEGKTFNVSLVDYVYGPSGIHFASPSDLLSPDSVLVDLSQVTTVAFTVPVDTVHISLTPDVTSVNLNDPLASITFTYHIDQLILEGQSASFDAQIDGGNGGTLFNVLTIDAAHLSWDDINQDWYGSFPIDAASLPSGVHNLTLVPSDLPAATLAFGMDDFAVNSTIDFNVVNNSGESGESGGGIDTNVFDTYVFHAEHTSGDALHGADLIDGFSLSDGDVLQFDDAFIGATTDFDLTNIQEDSTITSLSVSDGQVTFSNQDGDLEIDQNNLGQAVDFLVQHALSEPGLTVDFRVNNGSGFDIYVFNQGESEEGHSAYTLVNLSNQEAAGLSLGYTSSELIHIEHG